MNATAPRVTGRQLPDEFEQIFREHSEFVYRTAYRVTGNAEDAEDVLQTLFVQLLRRELPPGFQQNSKAYLYRSSVNIALNLIRSRKRTVLTDELDRISVPAEIEPSEELRAAMAELNPKAAEILVLRYVHGYSDAEIAGLLGTSRGTIAVSLFRAKARLRKSIRAYFGGKS